MSERLATTVSPVILGTIGNRSMCIPVTIDRTIETSALIDSGAGGTFIDKSFALKHGITLSPLAKPMPVYNVDGTCNKLGSIKEYTWRGITIAGTAYRVRLLATSLGNESIILGLPWLRRTNATINWQTGRLAIDDPTPKTTVETVAEESESTTTAYLDPELPYYLEEQITEPFEAIQDFHICNATTQVEPSQSDPIELQDDEILIAYIKENLSLESLIPHTKVR